LLETMGQLQQVLQALRLPQLAMAHKTFNCPTNGMHRVAIHLLHQVVKALRIPAILTQVAITTAHLHLECRSSEGIPIKAKAAVAAALHQKATAHRRNRKKNNPVAVPVLRVH